MSTAEQSWRNLPLGRKDILRRVKQWFRINLATEEKDVSVSWKIELPQLLLIAVMFVFVAGPWSSAPERIPVHWDLSGQPDRYSGKFEGLLLLPLIALGLYLLLLLLRRRDPRRANYARFRGAYLVLRVAILMFLVLIYGFVLLWTRGILLDVLLISILAGGLLVVMGVVMGRVQPNWFVGI